MAKRTRACLRSEKLELAQYAEEEDHELFEKSFWFCNRLGVKFKRRRKNCDQNASVCRFIHPLKVKVDWSMYRLGRDESVRVIFSPKEKRLMPHSV